MRLDGQDKSDYEKICKEITEKKPFAFTRWGDGEWFNIMKVKGQNCDGNIYYPDLGDALKAIVSVKQDYYMGKQSAANCYSAAENFKQDWMHADIFHWASIDGILKPLMDALESVQVVYIGNKDLKKLSFINEFIAIRQTMYGL